MGRVHSMVKMTQKLMAMVARRLAEVQMLANRVMERVRVLQKIVGNLAVVI